MALVIPDVVLLDCVNRLLNVIRSDYRTNVAASTESRSILYTLFNSLGLGDYDLYENVVQLIITTKENPKHIDSATLNFDLNSNRTPHIYITLPSESTVHNSLGIGQGDQDEVLIDNEDGQDQYRSLFNRRYLCTYQVVIMAENRNETLVLYHLFKNLLVASTNHLHLKGLQNLKIGGQDLILRDIPIDRVYRKAITLNFEYEQQVPELLAKTIYQKLQLYWKPEGAEGRQGPIEIVGDESDASSI
jgi:hypothetical protein